MRRIAFTLVFSLFVSLLHLSSSPAPANAVEPELCEINPTGLDCGPTYAPPELLNPGALSLATVAQAASLRRLSDLAVDNTLADHGLPASDRTAVLSWGRADAQAELLAIIVAAIKKPESERTADEQDAVDWMAELVRAQGQDSAEHVGAEYVKWAGLNQQTYRTLLSSEASLADLTEFLSGPVNSYDNPDTANATGGYCVYRAPAPYTDDYTGYQIQTCFTPCTSPIGCNLPTPSYDEFVDWGNARASADRVQDHDFNVAAGDIAAAISFGTAVVAAAAAGAAVSATLAAVGGTTLAVAMSPWFGIELFSTVVAFAEAGGSAAAGGAGVAAGAIGGTVAIVILAIVVAVLQAIKIADELALPGKIAQLIVDSRTQTTDLAATLATTEGATTIYSFFVGATLPYPRTDQKCDNSLISPSAYLNELGSTVAFIPVSGGGFHEEQISTTPCLNPPEIPATSPTDPTFRVRDMETGAVASSPTIEVVDEAAETTARVRVTGNWFVERFAGLQKDAQSLRLKYTDPERGTVRTWLLRHPDGGYGFVGVDSETTAVDPDTCEAAGTCWTSDTIDFVGTDGKHYRATLEPYAPPISTPRVTTEHPTEASPVSFDSAGFLPANPEGEVTYEWGFQRAGCGFVHGCVSSQDGTPLYDLATGPDASYTWQTSGKFSVRLVATDAAGKKAEQVFSVTVEDLPPRLGVSTVPVLSAPLPLAPVRGLVPPGDQFTLHGAVDHVGELDNVRVDINWGDSTLPDLVEAGPNTVVRIGNPVTLESFTQTRFLLEATHTYAEPGTYYGTVTVVNQGGSTDVRTFSYVVAHHEQVIHVPTIPPQEYGTAIIFTTGDLAEPLIAAQGELGDRLYVGVEGGASGNPIDYGAGPETVCTAGGPLWSRIKLIGLGTCTIRAAQPGTSYFQSAVKLFTVEVVPASLVVTADDKSKVYGADDPVFTATVDGLANGDTEASLGQLTVTGAPTDSPAGAYPIQVSGGSNPNYDITHVDGTETITPAPLTITADDKTRVYGADDPLYTASYDGLVNGDTETDVTGLSLTGASTSSGVGTYPIVASGATNPNYDISYADGTETITPAPLTITAIDKTVASGDVATYTWSGTGWVDADRDGVLDEILQTTPTCTATVSGAAASASTAPGIYPGAITCTGAENANYTITYAAGTLTVDPVITLAQTGLPATLPRIVTLDGSKVTLPVTRRQVAYGSAHGYAFPGYVPDSAGVLYVTLASGFTGPVVVDIDATATYRTVQQVTAAGVTARTIDNKYASTLTRAWAAVEKQIMAGKKAAALGALRDYAKAVRSQRGKKIATTVADDLLAMTQVVYTSTGGSGSV